MRFRLVGMVNAARLIPKKKIVYGCESRGDSDSPYLTRWTLLDTRFGKLYLHVFHRSDADELHDHPWNFTSFVLWRGYVEETPCPRCFHRDLLRIQIIEGLAALGHREAVDHILSIARPECKACHEGRIRRRKIPGMILRRPANWAHRVELVEGKRSVTLV